MKCGECDAFEFALKTTSARYAALLRVKSPKKGPEVVSARNAFKTAKEALRVHTFACGFNNRDSHPDSGQQYDCVDPSGNGVFRCLCRR
jgi:hypothetical protein